MRNIARKFPHGHKVQAPVNTALPYILGIGQVGQTLTATPGTWLNSPSFTFTFYRNNLSTPITSPSTSANYTAITADLGQTLYVGVTGTNEFGSATAYSTAPTYAAYQTTLAGSTPAFIYSVPTTPAQENNHLHQSPGGRYVSMSSYTITPFNEGTSYLGTEILLLDTNTGNVITAVPADPAQNNSNAEWWPDGQSFLYASTNMAGGPNPTHHGARRYFPATGADVIFYNPAMNVADFSVSPIGAVVMGGTTTINGFTTDALFVYYNGILKQLTTPNVTASFNPSGDFDPQWALSGNYISCSRSISPGLFTIVVIQVGGPQNFTNIAETVITPPGSAAAFDGLAPWSDGDQYITTWYTDPANRAANGIYYMAKDGTGRTQINLQAQAQFNTPSFVPGSGSSSSAQVLYSTQSLPIFAALPVNTALPTISL